MSNDGQVLYDRNAWPGKEPIGANGTYDVPHDGSDPSPTHVTQWYDDNTRVSWNAQNDGTMSDYHRTDQRKAKGSKGRHDL